MEEYSVDSDIQIILNQENVLKESFERMARAPSIFTPLRSKIDEVIRYVETFKGVFKDALQMLHVEIKRDNYYVQVYDAVLHDLRRKTRNVIIEVEDTIDFVVDLVAEYDKAGSNCKLQRIPRRPARNRKIASLVEKVRSLMEEKLEPLLQDVRKITDSGYPIRPYDYSLGTLQDYPTAAHRIKEPPRQDNVVGFEEVTSTIVQNLLKPEREFSRYSINGMWGVGKTTLASKIFHDPRIQNEFPIIIWASNFEDMIAALWDKLFPHEELPLQQPLEELATIVGDNLRTKKFLIILDDITTCVRWKRFSDALPWDTGSGKVLITTDNVVVADEASGADDDRMITLQCMDESTGWELLHFQVYGKMMDDDDSCPCPAELERVGKFIVKQCGGLPRAIVHIGKILAGKVSSILGTKDYENMNRKKELGMWKEVASSVKDYLFNPQDPGGIQNYMSIRYDKLPYQTKEYLLYLAMIPQETDISWSRLTRLWHATRYNNYDGSALIMTGIRNLARIKQSELCSFHILVREFCKKKLAAASRGKEEDVVDFQEYGEHDPIEEYGDLCINSDVHKFLSRKPNLEGIRSFLCFSKETITLENKDEIDAVAAAFSKLRAFEANTIKFPKFPTKLTRSIHLRYMLLSGDKINVLPRTISKWRHIQYLIVYTLSPTLKIKANIWEMTQLKHLLTKAAIVLNKDERGGEGCKNLEVLKYLSPQSCTEQVAEKAKKLSHLGIRGELGKLLESSFLEKLDRLEYLKLVHKVVVSGNQPRLLRLPPTSKFPPQLTTLVMSGTFLNWDNMTVIAGLGKLGDLTLKKNAFVGDRWGVEVSAFPSLTSLTIKNTNLRHWTAHDDSLRKLTSLELENCDKLEGVPMELVKKLKSLVLKSASQATISCAKEMEEDRRRMHEMEPLKLVIDSEVKTSTNGNQLFCVGLDFLYDHSSDTKIARRYNVPKMTMGY